MPLSVVTILYWSWLLHGNHSQDVFITLYVGKEVEYICFEFPNGEGEGATDTGESRGFFWGWGGLFLNLSPSWMDIGQKNY